jgi:hypothetical protein
MMRYVERRKPALAKLDERQLDEIMASPDFYARNLNRRSPDEESTVSEETFEFWALANLKEGEVVQLRLFGDSDAGTQTQ